METFWYLDIIELDNFGTRIFQHMNVSILGNFGTMQSSTDVSAQTFWHLCRNVLLCRNVHFAKISMCLNVPVPKCPCAKRSLCQNIQVRKCPYAEKPCAGKFMCRIVSLPKCPWRPTVHVPKFPGDEISVLKCFLPKCQVLK